MNRPKRKIVIIGIPELNNNEFREIIEVFNKTLKGSELEKEYFFMFIPHEFHCMEKKELLTGFKRAIGMLEICDD